MSSIQLSSISLSMVILWTHTHTHAHTGSVTRGETGLFTAACVSFVVLRKTEMDRSGRKRGRREADEGAKRGERGVG